MISRRCVVDFCVLVALAGPVAVLASGCGKDEPAAEEKKELVILCGSSFLPPCEEMVANFKAKTGVAAKITTGGSEDLLPHVKTGQMGDIYITHDPYLDYTRKADALADHVHVGFVAPVLAVQKGNPAGLKSIEDLTKPGLKVALSNPEYSTCGEMVFKLLEKKGIKDEVLKNVENRLTKGHPELGTLVKTGAVDAVMMWNGVANTFKDDLDVVPTPYEYDKEIRVHVIGLGYSKRPELVKRFVDLAKTAGTGVFAKHGYVKEASPVSTQESE